MLIFCSMFSMIIKNILIDERLQAFEVNICYENPNSSKSESKL